MDKYKLQKLDPRLVSLVMEVKAKRPRTVIEHIIEHGHITTEELKETYGYNHPPRAARDVRECGIPLETFKVTGTDGRRLAAYRFGDPAGIERHKSGGRRTFSKELKHKLYESGDGKCGACLESFAERYLQIDHRVPYEVAGDLEGGEDPRDFMLLCGSCNRRKSWSCEHCLNWAEGRDADVCRTCFWGDPGDYSHIATKPERRLEVVFQGDEVRGYDAARQRVEGSGRSLRSLVKGFIRGLLRD